MNALAKLIQQQGRQANQNGRAFEEQIIQRLKSKGYIQVAAIPEERDQPFFIYQHRGDFLSIYGLPMRVDFYVWNSVKYPDGLIIECKYQETSGSADEKFPYTIACLRKIGLPAILLLIGKGAKRCSVEWCLQQQDALLTVFADFESFFRAANRELL